MRPSTLMSFMDSEGTLYEFSDRIDHIRNLSLFKTSPPLLIECCIGSVPGGHPHSAADRHTLGRIGMIHSLVYPQNRVRRGAKSIRTE